MGFKNATDGDIQVAVDAIKSASQPHHFLSVTKQGHSAIFQTAGNEDCHVILRGGRHPNYDMFSVDDTSVLLAKSGLPARIMIDASHANSRKIPARQIDATWEAMEKAADASLVTALAMVCPFATAEKQALLEAANGSRRAETLIALLQMGGSEDDEDAPRQ